MNKFLIVVLMIFAASIIALAQTGAKKSDQWQNFAPFGEGFAAEIPASMTTDSRGDENQFYSTLSEGTYFFVFSDSLTSDFQVKTVLEFVKDKTAAKSVSTVGDFSGEKFNFADDEGFFHTILIVETKNRAYVFQTTSEAKKNPAVERFFAGIQLNRTIEKRAAKSEERDEMPVQEAPVSTAGSGQGNGKGSGIGSGIGAGSETASAEAQAKTKQTSALKILSKPRANYTDFARFYQVSGKVPLRVTFLANGNIGAVTAVKKLPFGLTNNAVEAARQIRFEPAMKEGAAYAVTKLVEYGFTIY